MEVTVGRSCKTSLLDVSSWSCETSEAWAQAHGRLGVAMQTTVSGRLLPSSIRQLVISMEKEGPHRLCPATSSSSVTVSTLTDLGANL